MKATLERGPGTPLTREPRNVPAAAVTPTSEAEKGTLERAEKEEKQSKSADQNEDRESERWSDNPTNESSKSDEEAQEKDEAEQWFLGPKAIYLHKVQMEAGEVHAACARRKGMRTRKPVPRERILWMGSWSEASSYGVHLCNAKACRGAGE